MTVESTTQPLSTRQVRLVIIGLMTGVSLPALDGTVVSTALPTVAGELGGMQRLPWVVTAYMLAATTAMPLYGKLGDVFGRKRPFGVAIFVMLVGGVLCASAQNMPQLIVFRAVQGAGGGGLLVLAHAIMTELVSPRERGRYQGYFGAVFGTASLAGPIIGGLLADHVSWRMTFVLGIPFALIALLVTSIVMPHSEADPARRVDVLGSGILSVWIVSVVLFCTWGGTVHGWTSPVMIALAVTAVALLVALLIVERAVDDPVVPVQLFPGFRS